MVMTQLMMRTVCRDDNISYSESFSFSMRHLFTAASLPAASMHLCQSQLYYSAAIYMYISPDVASLSIRSLYTEHNTSLPAFTSMKDVITQI